ncbi:TPA: hypothetical protein ACK0LO_000517 [Providencia stuartii]
MSKFDRDLQLELLLLAANDYPREIDENNIPQHLRDMDEDKLCANIAYLEEEGLIVGGVEFVGSGPYPAIELIRITNEGINLITEEGSISASLKVVTIKLHNDTLSTLRDFINQNVSDLEERKGYLQRLKELPADATKHLVLELLGKGLNQMPNAIHWLQTALHS